MTRYLPSVFVIALTTAAGVVFAGGTTTTRDANGDLGGFEIQALVGGEWQPAGYLSFGRAVREGLLQVPPNAFQGSEVSIRLVQRGGGAAFIDAATLGGRPPVAVAGLAEPEASALVSSRDNDLVDVFGRTVELKFAPSSASGELRLSARVEGKVIVGSPFSFPPENSFRPVTADSAFYSYTPKEDGRTPDWPATLETENAFFSQLCQPTTGHPIGVTYGWVANDGETLYAAVEFTSDNTCDGNKDWSAVWVRRGEQTREFRVSEADTRWGRPSFLVTDRAPYRHKLYSFEIPLREIGITDVADAGDLDLAFEAYGTSAVSLVVLPTPWDFGAVLVGDAAPLQTFTVYGPPNGATLSNPWYTQSGPDSAAFPLTVGGVGACGNGVLLASVRDVHVPSGFHTRRSRLLPGHHRNLRLYPRAGKRPDLRDGARTGDRTDPGRRSQGHSAADRFGTSDGPARPASVLVKRVDGPGASPPAGGADRGRLPFRPSVGWLARNWRAGSQSVAP